MADQERAGENVDGLAVRLSELWSDERCDWTLRFDAPSYGNKGCWMLTLEWTQEYGTDHQADWTTYHWEFYAHEGEGGPDDVLRQAVDWCADLATFREHDDG